ncbi:hypothetical protein [uncultured Sporomusa sp.]|uniref:hypothetical protein n=1 Tax=uncultured Sporomusa sp. TaxID=307249 RepID=UPI00258EFED0|nr:hypothetical protein [uncultured Sporomusa sp.]
MIQKHRDVLFASWFFAFCEAKCPSPCFRLGDNHKILKEKRDSAVLAPFRFLLGYVISKNMSIIMVG